MARRRGRSRQFIIEIYKAMAKLYFDSRKIPSTKEEGFFPIWTRKLFPNYLSQGWYDFELAQVKTNLKEFSFGDYIDKTQKLSSGFVWNFSDKNDFVTLSHIRSTSDQSDPDFSLHSVSKDSFYLGSGNDVLWLKVGGDGYREESVLVPTSPKGGFKYSSYQDLINERGTYIVVDGGIGNDRLNVSANGIEDILVTKRPYTLGATDFIEFTYGDWETVLAVPVADIKGDRGNDTLTVTHVAGKLSGGTGSDVLNGSYFFSDFISGGPGPDVITGSWGYPYDEQQQELFQVQKDILSGGPGKDNFRIAEDAYSFNGNNDFALITDFEKGDRITSSYFRGDLLIDKANGSIQLAETATYESKTYAYTARLFLDTDDNGKVGPDDELLMYVCGAEPTTASILYG